MELSYKTISPEETRSLGEKIGGILQGGEIICLQGELGAGKTVFAKGLGKALKVSEHIISPTFTMIKDYAAQSGDGNITFVHMDLYRLQDAEEAEVIGVTDFFREDCICLIEWPEIIEEMLPEERLEIVIEGQGEETRNLRFRFMGSEAEEYIHKKLKELL